MMNLSITRSKTTPSKTFGKKLLGLTAAVVFIAGCSTGGEDNASLPNTTTTVVTNYTGPVPATADVQQFKLNLWDNLVPENRCGSCHTTDGQVPTFVQSDDINTAYSVVNPLVDLASPGDSRLVQKVAAGHNCWLTSNSACGDIMTAYIAAWAGGSGSTSNAVVLQAPTLRDPGSSKTFPVDPSSFGSTIHPILTTNCSNCHSDSAATPQAPFFASSDIAVAYAAAKNKISLDNAESSRMVIRLRSEFHNCWSGVCSDDADAMAAAITSFSSGISTSVIDPTLVLSKALTLVGDGIVASGGGRHETNAIALYQFKTGSGNTAFDTSGIEPSLNLSLTGDYSWVGGWGISVANGKAQGSTTNSKKLHELITATGEYSIEAWVAPGNVTQEGPAGIVSYSGGSSARNFTLGQTLYNYNALNRSSTTGADGEPAVSTPDADEVLQATLQHVVVNYDPVNGRQIFVNGMLRSTTDTEAGGTLTGWDDTFALAMGNEPSNDRIWQGSIRMVAIHNRALTQEQITQNFSVGVGQKFYLLFSVGHLINVPESYIIFEVSQFDNFSYLFNKPFFLSLDSEATIGSIPVQGMRIGINGKEAAIGQSYRSLDITLNDTDYTEAGQVMSPLGTIIALENGPVTDQFFLTFERLGSNTNVVTEPVPPTPAPPADLPQVSDIGVRTFSEINATMAVVTGVDQTLAAVASTYTTITQQLPPVEDIDTFLSTHQMAVTQLAIRYCSELVEDSTLRDTFFGAGFGFEQDVASAFGSGDSAAKNQIVTQIFEKMIGLPGAIDTPLTSSTSLATLKAELIGPAATNSNNLFDRLTSACPTNCDSTRTKTIVKAMCASTLGSAAILVQ
ncbi:MAG: LamG domain-containing protein [Pseudomonadales bacterium]|nr:LamG domain-containing protein [Pseudomonadales bacterium]